MTGTGFKRRWWSHISQANKGHPTHRPILNAIRKYGQNNFTVKILHDGLNKESAIEVEQLCIAFLGTKAPNGYNLTEGGEAGSGRIFWDRLNSDPVKKKEYLKRLSDACKNGKHMKRLPELLAAGALWRANNPEQVKHAARKAHDSRLRRIMADPEQRAKMLASAERKRQIVPYSNKKYHSQRLSNMVARIWASRSDEYKRTVGSNISKSQKEKMSRLSPEEKKQRDDQLASARAAVDRKKWAAAIDAGRKAYWTPERRAAKGAKTRARYAAARSVK